MSEKTNGHIFRANASSFNPEAREFIPSGFSKNVLTSDIDARCGEVVEILEDAIGDSADLHDDDYDNNLNDDELLEMLEMQEECRREMIKTYVQANNPTMFEEIYYNVAYPDEAIIPLHGQNVNYQQQEGVVLDTLNNLNINENNQQHQQQQQQQLSALDLIKTNLNPNANEFIPKKFLDTKH